MKEKIKKGSLYRQLIHWTLVPAFIIFIISFLFDYYLQYQLMTETKYNQIFEEINISHPYHLMFINHSLMLGVAVSLFTVIVLIVIRLRIIRPLRTLSRHADAVVQGDLSIWKYHNRQNEITAIHENLNQLSQKLAANEKRLWKVEKFEKMAQKWGEAFLPQSKEPKESTPHTSK